MTVDRVARPTFTTIGVPIDSVGLGRAEAHGTELAPDAVRRAGLSRLGLAGRRRPVGPDPRPRPGSRDRSRRSRRRPVHDRRAASGGGRALRRRRAPVPARRLLHAPRRGPGRREGRTRDSRARLRRRPPRLLRRTDVADRRGRRHAGRRRARRRAGPVGRARCAGPGRAGPRRSRSSATATRPSSTTCGDELATNRRAGVLAVDADTIRRNGPADGRRGRARPRPASGRQGLAPHRPRRPRRARLPGDRLPHPGWAQTGTS